MISQKPAKLENRNDVKSVILHIKEIAHNFPSRNSLKFTFSILVNKSSKKREEEETRVLDVWRIGWSR